MSAAATRRAVLGAFAAAPVLAASCNPVPAAAAQGSSCTPMLDRADWDAKLEHLAACVARSNLAGKAVDDADTARERMTPRPDHIDWAAFPPFADRDHLLNRSDLSNAFGSARIERANDQIRAWRAAKEANDAKLRWHEINEEWNEAAEAWGEAESVLIRTPAPDLDALAWKIERLLDSSDGYAAGWSAEYLEITMADVRRLLRGEV